MALRGVADQILRKLGVRKGELQRQEADPVPNSNRSPWSDNPLMRGMTPGRLADILQDVRSGNLPDEYLELTQEIERRDSHYRSVLSTRKQAVEGLDVVVTAGSEDDRDLKIADAVRTDVIAHTGFPDLVKHALDALGKGFSVNEIIWDTSGDRWRPGHFHFRDPRWFAYDRDDGTLKLRASHGSDLIPLKPYKYVVHEPILLSGTQITAGLAYTALFLWLVKSFDVSSWAAFVDRFGFPIRIGKYGPKATKEDQATLKRAIASIGSDIGAVVPQSMVIEIIEAKDRNEAAEVYERLADWVDRQHSKLVLGQTMTTDDGSSRAQADVHNEVKQEYTVSDGSELAKTINRDLIRPYVLFNYGEQRAYPRVVIQPIETQDVKLVVESVEKLGPLGLKVKADEIRTMLRLSHPDDGDSIIGGVPATPSTTNDTDETAANNALALNAQGVANIEDKLLEEAAAADYVEITDEIAAVIGTAAAESETYEQFRARLETVMSDWPAEKAAQVIAIATFKARAEGDATFDEE